MPDCILPLTQRQTDVLLAIYRHALTREEWPTRRSLAHALGMISVNGAHNHLVLLHRKGWVWHIDQVKRSRGLRLAGASLILTFEDSPAGAGLRRFINDATCRTRTDPTRQEAQMLREICRHATTHGEWPTYQDLADYLGYAGLNAIFEKVHSLRRKGYIAPAAGTQARLIRLLGAHLTLSFDDSRDGQRLREVVEGRVVLT